MLALPVPEVGIKVPGPVLGSGKGMAMILTTLPAVVAADPSQAPPRGQAFCASVHELPKRSNQAHLTDEETEIRKSNLSGVPQQVAELPWGPGSACSRLGAGNHEL